MDPKSHYSKCGGTDDTSNNMRVVKSKVVTEGCGEGCTSGHGDSGKLRYKYSGTNLAVAVRKCGGAQKPKARKPHYVRMLVRMLVGMDEKQRKV